jgi:hypothetical protein
MKDSWVLISEKIPPLGQPVLVKLKDGTINWCRYDVDQAIRLSDSDGGAISFVRYYLHNIEAWRKIDE